MPNWFATFRLLSIKASPIHKINNLSWGTKDILGDQKDPKSAVGGQSAIGGDNPLNSILQPLYSEWFINSWLSIQGDWRGNAHTFSHITSNFLTQAS